MPARDATQITHDLLLVVEGQAEIPIFREMRRHHSIEGFQTFAINGRNKQRGFFKNLAVSPHFRTPVADCAGLMRAVAVVLDAEDDAASTFRSVRDALLNAGLPAPDAPGGIAEGELRVGVFLVPDNQTPGMIETLCLRSVDGDPALACLDEYFRCFVAGGGTLPTNMHKARAQAFLATRPKPNLSVGIAAEERYWSLGHAAFSPLTDFLRKLATP